MTQQIFDQACINLWQNDLSGKRLTKEKKLIVYLGQLNKESRVLDLGSGTGRISRALGAEGIRVVGIERSKYAFKEAISSPHPNCLFINSDWKDRKWRGKFDCVLFWFTTLCAGRIQDSESLKIAYSSLVNGGVLLIETRHWDRSNRRFDKETRHRFGKDILIEKHAYNSVTGMQTTQEYYRIGNKVINRQYQTRRYSFPELREMCLETGFVAVDGFDEKGSVLSDSSERAILRALK